MHILNFEAPMRTFMVSVFEPFFLLFISRHLFKNLLLLDEYLNLLQSFYINYQSKRLIRTESRFRRVLFFRATELCKPDLVLDEQQNVELLKSSCPQE